MSKPLQYCIVEVFIKYFLWCKKNVAFDFEAFSCRLQASYDNKRWFFGLFSFLRVFFAFYCILISPFVPGENGDCLWPLQLQKTEKLKMWANFPYICVFSAKSQSSGQWENSNCSSHMHCTAWSVKYKVLPIYWTTKYVKHNFLYLHGLKSYRRSKSMHHFLHQRK